MMKGKRVRKIANVIDMANNDATKKAIKEKILDYSHGIEVWNNKTFIPKLRKHFPSLDEVPNKLLNICLDEIREEYRILSSAYE